MKIRMDFVTNSSSSSFLIVGTNDEDYINKMIEIENLRDEVESGINYGCLIGENIEFWGSYDIYYAGISIYEDLKKGENYNKIKEKFKKLLKDKYNINILDNEINIHYGELGL